MTYSAHDVAALLTSAGLLSGLDESALADLSPPPELISLVGGEVLMRQGENGTNYFLLVRGRLRVSVDDGEGGERVVGEIRPGEGVGEMSLISDQPRSATVRAKLDSEVVRFSQEAFSALMERHPAAAMNVTREVVRRLHAQYSGKPTRRAMVAAIAVVPIGDGVDARGFADVLTQALAAHGTTLHLDEAQFGDPDAPDFVRRVNQTTLDLDGRYDFLVFSSSGQPGAWTRQCLLHADLVLLAGRVGDSPAPSRVEAELLATIDPILVGRIELVLLHDSDWQAASATRDWLAVRRVADYHHLRRGVAADLARLARLVVGKGNGLVLGGGGARGFASVGVLRALDEAGVPVDRIGGTSMGSMIAAHYAARMSHDEVMEIGRRHWMKGKPASDYTLPLMSLVRGRRMQAIASTVFGDREIQDLPIRFFCASSDLGNADLVLHKTGSLWRAVRASGSFPVVGPPMFFDGRILIDGGVLNNLPADIMRAEFGGSVIGVEVSAPSLRSIGARWSDQTPSAWQLLWGAIRPVKGEPKLPNIMEILHRTTTLNSDRLALATRKTVDLLIAPPLGDYGITDFAQMERIVDIGYRHTLERLEAIAASGEPVTFAWGGMTAG